MSITPKNWETFQHYKDRAPAWIKLHKGLLTDYKFACLPVASRALAPCLWLLASEYDGGKITADFDEIAFRLHMTKAEVCEALNPLIEAGFFTCASELLAERKQDAIPEKRDIENIEKIEGEERSSLRSDFPPDFREMFWRTYPLKKGKSGALKVLEAIRKRNAVPWATLLDAVAAYAATADPQFTKHPKTWLLNGCWDDEPDTRKPNGKTSVIDAQRQHIANKIDFGPRPSLSGGALRVDAPRLLPQGRCERPGDLHGGDHGDPGGIPGGGDPVRDGPSNGDRTQDQLATDRGRG